jgi:hypothetical protein
MGLMGNGRLIRHGKNTATDSLLLIGVDYAIVFIRKTKQQEMIGRVNGENFAIIRAVRQDEYNIMP